MIDLFKAQLKSISLIGLHQLRSDLPKVRENLDVNFIGKFEVMGSVLGIYKYANLYDKFGLKLIHSSKTSENHKIISIDELTPVAQDGQDLAKVLKNKSTAQGIFNFSFKIDQETFFISIYINSPLKQYFCIITKQ